MAPSKYSFLILLLQGCSARRHQPEKYRSEGQLRLQPSSKVHAVWKANSTALVAPELNDGLNNEVNAGLNNQVKAVLHGTGPSAGNLEEGLLAENWADVARPRAQARADVWSNVSHQSVPCEGAHCKCGFLTKPEKACYPSKLNNGAEACTDKCYVLGSGWLGKCVCKNSEHVLIDCKSVNKENPGLVPCGSNWFKSFVSDAASRWAAVNFDPGNKQWSLLKKTNGNYQWIHMGKASSLQDAQVQTPDDLDAVIAEMRADDIQGFAMKFPGVATDENHNLDPCNPFVMAAYVSYQRHGCSRL